MRCGTCGKRLERSMKMVQNGQRLKSCPNCSTLAGRHQFYREDDFGIRDMGDGRHILQSWCPECRVKQPPRRAIANCG